MTRRTTIMQADLSDDEPLESGWPCDEDHIDHNRPRVQITRQATTPEVFHDKPSKHHRTMTSSTTAVASPAVLKSPEGDTRPGVALIDDRGPRLVITAEAALRLANQIADALQYFKTISPNTETPNEKETA